MLLTSSIVAGMFHSYWFEIFLIVPLRILPLLVLGSFSMKMTPISLAKAPTSVLTLSLTSFFRVSSSYGVFSLAPAPRRITKANGHSPLTYSLKPMTALSTTLSCSLITSSRRPVEIRWPHVLMTSSILVMICKYPFSSLMPASPVV